MDFKKGTPSIINEIMDMDLNDGVAVESVMHKIVSHPFAATFFLGSLIGTKQHRSSELVKSIFFYHGAWTPHDLRSFVFGIDEGPHFLVNIFELMPYPRHGIPFSHYGKRTNEKDIPVPPLQYRNIEKFVRIDVFGNRRYKIRNLVMSENSAADGRFFSIRNIDIDEMIVSLHRRIEGYKTIDQLTNYNEVWEELHEDDESADQMYVDPNDTFENKILNIVYEVQKDIKHPGDLTTLAQAVLPGVKVYQPYKESGFHVVAVESPVDRTLFMLIFERTVKRKIEDRRPSLKANMRNLLAHYIPQYIAKKRHTILLAISYNIDPGADFHSIETIISLMHSSESSEFKKAVESYKNKVTLMHRCRQVILKNMCQLCDQISEVPLQLQRFIYSSENPIELIDYCIFVDQ